MTEKDTAPEGVPDKSKTGTALSIDDAAEIFTKRLGDAERPSEPEGGEMPADDRETEPPDEGAEQSDAQDSGPGEDDAGPDEDAEEDEGDDDEADIQYASDDHKVKITVDGEEHRVPVKDLKRLWGQEASLTRKSQEVASSQKLTEEHGIRYATALGTMLGRAQARVRSFAGMDMTAASQQLNAADFAQLRSNAEAADAEYRGLSQEMAEAASFVQVQQENARNLGKARALEQIQDTASQNHIPDWNDGLYDEILKFATSEGMPEDVVNGIVDPAAIKLINKARLYDAGRKAAAVKKTRAKTKTTGTRVVNSKTTSSSSARSRREHAMAQLRKSGSLDDAAAAFVAGWE